MDKDQGDRAPIEKGDHPPEGRAGEAGGVDGKVGDDLETASRPATTGSDLQDGGDARQQETAGCIASALVAHKVWLVLWLLRLQLRHGRLEDHVLEMLHPRAEHRGGNKQGWSLNGKLDFYQRFEKMCE